MNLGPHIFFFAFLPYWDFFNFTFFTICEFLRFSLTLKPAICAFDELGLTITESEICPFQISFKKLSYLNQSEVYLKFCNFDSIFAIKFILSLNKAFSKNFSSSTWSTYKFFKFSSIYILFNIPWIVSKF